MYKKSIGENVGKVICTESRITEASRKKLLFSICNYKRNKLHLFTLK